MKSITKRNDDIWAEIKRYAILYNDSKDNIINDEVRHNLSNFFKNYLLALVEKIDADKGFVVLRKYSETENFVTIAVTNKYLNEFISFKIKERN